MGITTNTLLKSLCAGVMCLTSAASMASVVITGTRVIYPANEKEVSVKLTNAGQGPILIQSWLDKGDVNAKPENITVPFILTPPINRVEGGKGQTLRLSYTGATLPTDRETVFWLNVLEIPAKVKATSANNYLQMAFRSRIKLFFRPPGLEGNANDAANALIWKAISGGVNATNATPYYVSLVSVAINVGGKLHRIEGEMIPPKSSLDLALKGNLSLARGNKISAEFVNDYGAVNTLESTLN